MNIKQFSVDIDDPKELKKLSCVLNARRNKILRNLGYEEIKFNFSKYHIKHILPIIEEMYNNDFSDFYEEKSLNNKNYYVYFHCNPNKKLNIKNLKHLFLAKTFNNLKFEPFYVGKGQGTRYLDFDRNNIHRKIRQEILKSNKDIETVIVENNLSNAQSLSKESILIDILGLKALNHNGILSNLDEGINNQERRLKYKTSDNDKALKILKSNGFKL